jgi:hypothetical protein
MDHATKEGSRGKHDSSRSNFRTVRQNDAANGFSVQDNVNDFTFNDGDTRMRHHFCLHLTAVNRAIRLRTRPLHSRAFTAVQQTKLDTGLIGYTRHDAVHCINLAHQVPFAQAADRRVARHYTDTFERQRHQRHARTTARCRVRGFCTGVSSADDNDVCVSMFHVKHPLLSNAKA